jgi:hypothetical protein
LPLEVEVEPPPFERETTTIRGTTARFVDSDFNQLVMGPTDSDTGSSGSFAPKQPMTTVFDDSRTFAAVTVIFIYPLDAKGNYFFLRGKGRESDELVSQRMLLVLTSRAGTDKIATHT